MDCGVVVKGAWGIEGGEGGMGDEAIVGIGRQHMVDNVIGRKQIDTPDEFNEGMEKKRPFLHEIATKGKVLYG